MFFSAVFALLLLDAPQQPVPPPTFDQAIQMAGDGRDAEALAAFQQIAAANPDDLKARLWIAQLQERRGDHEDDEQHENHVDQGRDVDLAHRSAVRLQLHEWRAPNRRSRYSLVNCAAA